MNIEELKKGDKVVHNSGSGPTMSVISINSKSEEIKCEWYDKTEKKFLREEFIPEVLEKYVPSPRRSFTPPKRNSRNFY